MSELNILDLLNRHWGKILGGLFGLIFALLVINYGFWLSIFIFLCIAIGLLVGWRLDGSKSIGSFFSRIFSSRDDY